MDLTKAPDRVYLGEQETRHGPLYRPVVERDDTPTHPAAGLWLVRVPRASEKGRPTQFARAYFTDLTEARTWAVTGWRIQHGVTTAESVMVTTIASYRYATSDPAQQAAAEAWRASVGAELETHDVAVVLRALDPSRKVHQPLGRPISSTDHALAAYAATEFSRPLEGDPLQVTRAERAAWQKKRTRLVDDGLITADMDDEACFEALIIPLLHAELVSQKKLDAKEYALEDLVGLAYDHLVDLTPEPGEYAGPRRGVFVAPTEADMMPTPRKTPLAAWQLTKLAPDCWILWQMRFDPERGRDWVQFFDMNEEGRPSQDRAAHFPTAEAAIEGAGGVDQVRRVERLWPPWVRAAFFRQHPDALRLIHPRLEEGVRTEPLTFQEPATTRSR
jgi:hypothetical protein